MKGRRWLGPSDQEAGDHLGMGRRCGGEPGSRRGAELPASPFRSAAVFVSLAGSLSTRPLLENEPGSGHSPVLQTVPSKEPLNGILQRLHAIKSTAKRA